MLKTIICMALYVGLVPCTVAASPDGASGFVPKGEKVEKLAGEMKFTEGPVWLPKQEIVVFSDIPNSKLMQWSKKEGLKVFRDSKNSNGNILDKEGRLLTCQHSGRNVIRTEKDGTVKVLADKFEGKKFNSPNDLVEHPDGSIWFTDPSYGLRGQKGEIDGKNVYRLDLKSGKVTMIYDGFHMPNGIVFSPDAKRVYISDTGRIAKIRAFDVINETKISEKPVFEIDVRCDGMCVDTEGNVYTTTKTGIQIFDKNGKQVGVIEVPEQPANVCFGGKNFDTLFITARRSLYSVKTNKIGYKLVLKK